MHCIHDSGQINIGGAHIKPTKPLPVELQRFLDEAKDGVIYFSLGSVVKSSKLPKDKIRAFLGIFYHNNNIRNKF